MRPGEQLLIASRRVRRRRGVQLIRPRRLSPYAMGSLQFLSKNPHFATILQWFCVAASGIFRMAKPVRRSDLRTGAIFEPNAVGNALSVVKLESP
jgi:hypothetical protein